MLHGTNKSSCGLEKLSTVPQCRMALIAKRIPKREQMRFSTVPQCRMAPLIPKQSETDQKRPNASPYDRCHCAMAGVAFGRPRMPWVGSVKVAYRGREHIVDTGAALILLPNAIHLFAIKTPVALRQVAACRAYRPPGRRRRQRRQRRRTRRASRKPWRRRRRHKQKRRRHAVRSSRTDLTLSHDT